MQSPPLVRAHTNLDDATAAALSEVLGRAIALLDAEPRSLRVREAEHLLRDVDARLGALGASHAEQAAAGRLLELRDDLSSHLRAASVCASDGLPLPVIAHLLRRGAWLTKSMIADVLVVVPRSVVPDDEPRPPTRFAS